MEIAEIRRRVQATILRARQRETERRVRSDEAARAYSTFLDTIAVPLFRQIANVLRAEGYLFGVFTPSGSVKLTSEKSADDSIELTLDTSGDEPRVLARTRHARGRRVIESETPVGDPSAITEHNLVEFVLGELEEVLRR
jgi:hypothetical protein